MDKKFGIIINEENDTNELEKITYTNDQKLFQNIICNKAIINNFFIVFVFNLSANLL